MTARITEEIGHRFCMYLRKSRADVQKEIEMGEGYDALAHHEQQLLDFASRIGVTITETYRELVSADSIEDRAEMQRLLEDIEEGMWDGVFVVEVERLCRGAKKDQGIVGEAIVDNEVFVLTPQKIYDPTDESDMEYFDFGLFMSRREYLTIRRRLLGGKINHARAGEYIGRIAPFGYDKVRKGGLKTLVPNDDARYVKLIFEWYAYDSLEEGKTSIAAIARKMNELAVPAVRGGVWKASSVHFILTNHHYTGKVRWMNRVVKKKKGTCVRSGGAKIKASVQNPEPYMFEGLHEAIISQELFDRVQAKLEEKKSPYPRTRTPRNYYSSLLTCSDCGKYLVFEVNRQGFPCFKHPGNKHGCPSKSCRVSSVDALVSEWLKSEARDLEVRVKDDTMESRVALYESEKARLEAEIAKSKRIMAENADRLEAGIYTDEMFLERKAMHEERIANAQKALSKLEVPSDSMLRERITTVHKCIDALSDPDFDVIAKNVLLKSVIKSIGYSNHGDHGDDSQMVLVIDPV